MATILMTHEFGGGLGHVNRLLAIARSLPDHQLVFALPDTRLARPAIEAVLGRDVRVLECRAWDMAAAAYNTAIDPPRTLADTLFLFGFGDAALLDPALRMWRSLLESVSPDLVVSDFAPTMRIAAAGRVPNVMVGSGFTVPPRGAPLPSMRPGDRTASVESQRRESLVLTAVNFTRLEDDLAPFSTVSGLFQGDATFPATFAALDPYRALRTTPPIQPFNIPALPIGPPFERRIGPQVFCYLDADYPGINAVLTALNGLARPSQVFVRNLDPHEVARHCAPQVGVHQGQADFRMLLPQTRLLVHHGGLGTTAAGLLAGVPQLLLPRHVEQDLTVQALAPLACSVGLRLNAVADAADVRRIVEQLLDHPGCQANALVAAADLQSIRVLQPEREVEMACLALLDGGPSVLGRDL